MLEQFGRNRLSIKNTRRDRVGHGRLQMSRVVTHVQIPSRTLMESVDDLTQLPTAKLAVFPPLEGLSDCHQGPTELLLVRSGRVLTKESLDPLRRIPHASVCSPSPGRCNLNRATSASQQSARTRG